MLLNNLTLDNDREGTQAPPCHTEGAPNGYTIYMHTWKGKCKEVVCTQFMWDHPHVKGAGVGISNAAEEEKTSSKSIPVKEINVSLKIAR